MLIPTAGDGEERDEISRLQVPVDRHRLPIIYHELLVVMGRGSISHGKRVDRTASVVIDKVAFTIIH